MFKIVSGDFRGATLVGNELAWFTRRLWPPPKMTDAQVLEGNIREINVLDEEAKPKLSHRLGYGLAGGALAGPLGAIGGALLAGKKKDFYIEVVLTNGKRFIAKVDQKTYVRLCGYKVKTGYTKEDE